MSKFRTLKSGNVKTGNVSANSIAHLNPNPYSNPNLNHNPNLIITLADYDGKIVEKSNPNPTLTLILTLTPDVSRF